MATLAAVFTPNVQDSPATQTLATGGTNGAAVLIGPRRIFQVYANGDVNFNTGASTVAAATDTSPMIPAFALQQFESGNLFTHIRFHSNTSNGANSALVSVLYLDRS